MKNQIYKGVEIMSLAADGVGSNRGKVRLRARLEADAIAPVNAEQLAARLKAAGKASLWYDQKSQQKQDNFNFERIDDVLPDEGDYITVPFRAISQAFIPGHCLDFTGDGVLEAAVPLIYGQTVYPNHDLFDINNALGSISASAWDGDDAAAKGAPGINVQYKIDALMNPRIARLLLMKPPAIHSTSLTLLFEFEFSHPDLVEQGRFWNLLGDEVEGSIVRLIVTKINECWEGSLVFMGADRRAKQLPDDDEDDEGSGQLSEKEILELGKKGADTPPNSNEEKTMKLTSEQKTKLGIEFDGEDVPETELLKAGESLAEKLAAVDTVNFQELTARAAAGDALVAKQRDEVTRLAKLAELGAEEGDLDEVVSTQIENADVETLVKLEGYYQKKVGDRFPKDGRSSMENSDEIDNAGGVGREEAELPDAGLL